ncbi:DUF5659 domain-containing protein [Patescibacteria group bacterium]
MNKHYSSDQYYLTSDLSLCGYISISIPLHDLIFSNPRKATFIFKRNKKFEQLLKSYFRREALVEPRQYFDSIKALKARLYSEGGNA